MSGWYACDFDGTLVTYDKWVGPEHAGEPIMRTVRRVRHWLRKGRDVRIFTARVSWNPEDSDSLKNRDQSIETINEVCLKCFGKTLPITCKKDYHMVALLDDRCLQVFPNTGELVQERLRKAEEKLVEFGVVYENDKYVYNGKD